MTVIQRCEWQSTLDRMELDPTLTTSHLVKCQSDGADMVMCPVQVICWRAHPASIACVRHIPDHDLLLTAAADATAALWRPDGAKVGVFGIHRWLLDDTSTWANPTGPQRDALYSATRFSIAGLCARRTFSTLRALCTLRTCANYERAKGRRERTACRVQRRDMGV